MIKPLSTFVRFLLVLILFAALFSYAMFQGGFVSWFLFFGFLPIIVYSIAMIFYPMNLMSVERSVSRKLLEAGQTVMVELRINRRIPFPILFLVIEDRLPDSINWHDTRQRKYKFLRSPHMLKNREANKTILFPLFRSKIVYTYEIDAVPRGRHILNEIKVVTGDFLGLVKKEKVFNVHTDLVAQPRELPLKIKNEISFFEEGEQTAYSLQANKTNVVSGIREYAPGDNVSWIDWKATAKKQKLFTKEFEQEKHKDLSIIFNMVKGREEDWLAFEASIEIALSLANQSMKDHGKAFVVGLGNRRKSITLSSRRQNDQLIRFLSEIKLVNEGTFSSMLLKEGRSLSKDQNLIVITHQLDRHIAKACHQLNNQDIKMSVVFIRSKYLLSASERQYIDQLSHGGIFVTWLNEDQLFGNQIEVNA